MPTKSSSFVLSILLTIGCAEPGAIEPIGEGEPYAQAPANGTPPVDRRPPPPEPVESVWSEVTRPLLTSSDGRPVVLSCHNCYEGPGHAVLSAAEAGSKIAGAIAAGADAIEIDVVGAGGTLIAAHDDTDARGDHPELSTLLGGEALVESDALLLLEIKETGTDPKRFASMLLEQLRAHPRLAREGRPILIRGFSARLAYLEALRDAAVHDDGIGPHLRFWMLYFGSEALEELKADVEREVARQGFDGIDVEYRSSWLAEITDYARSLGLGVGTWTVPGRAFGDVSLASLAGYVDLITTDYDLARARELVEAAHVWASADANGTAVQSSTPTSSGVLVTVETRLGSVELAPGETVPILRTDDDRGFRLELHREADAITVLRFGVRVDGAFVWHSYPVSGGVASAVQGGANGVYTDAIPADRLLTLTGVYDGDGGVYLLVDQRVAGAARPTISGPIEWGEGAVVSASEARLDGDERRLRGTLQHYAVSDWSE